MRSDLNDYECMLATSTCNVALQCSLSPCSDDEKKMLPLTEAMIRKAWMQTVEQRALLQIKLVPKEGEFGVLGQRYTAALIETECHIDLIRIKQYNDEAPAQGLLPILQRNGTSAMDLSKGSYFLDCRIVKRSPRNQVTVLFFLTLCHAVSDGPGALQVAHDFFQHFQEAYSGTESSTTSTTHDNLIDLQSLLLDDAYGKEIPERDCFPGVTDFKESLGATNPTDKKYLPPEALQKIPSDPEFGGPSKIDAISITLTKEQTTELVNTARSFGGTIQGVISVVCLLTRLKLLHQELPITCALQIPVNCRGSVKNKSVSIASCLCGSAGVWHTLDVETLSLVSDLVAKASRSVKDAVQDNQHLEWLRRLMNDPSSLPPYSLMMSSIGVAPLQDTSDVTLDDAVFFGGALADTTAPSQAQSTMTHVTTFGGKLGLTLSFTHPGVSLSFASASTSAIKALLIAMAGGTLDGVTCGDLLAETAIQWTTANSE